MRRVDPEDIKVTPSYSSEGLLMSHTEERHWSGDTPGPDGEDSLWLVSNNETTHLFYFAGRPVGQLTDGALFSITTDHLGTPVLITNAAGTPVWAGGLEPFGRPWTAGGNPDPEPLTAASRNDKGLSRLSSESAFLRYPGQWASDAFRVGNVRMEVYYNVHRWYEVGTGRYGQVDPVGLDAYRRAEVFQLPPGHLFAYTDGNPLNRIDPRGASWYDWVPGVKQAKCIYYTNRCIREIECCLKATGLGNLYSGDEEDIAERFNRFGGRWSPQWIECFQKIEACQKWITYCGKSAQAKPPGTGRDPGSGPPILTPP